MLCSQMQVVIISEEPPQPSTLLAHDVVKSMGYGVVDDGKFIAHENFMNVEGKTLHRVRIYEGCISVDV